MQLHLFADTDTLADMLIMLCAQWIYEAHMTTVRLTIKVPLDIKDWLAKRAEHFGATLGAEVSRCCRVSMQREADEATRRTRADTAEAAE
jgi:hypothetical protein